jgi:ribosomal protein S18 acetylase RimI-like enzyme
MNETLTRISTRPLTENDFPAVVNIDAFNSGRRRPGFFEKRLLAAMAEPDYFIYIGHDVEGELKGYLLARLLEGEYGAKMPVAVLDAIGVEPSCKGLGIGRQLLQSFIEILEHKQIPEIHTEVDWRNTDFLNFLSAAGFLLAPKQILECEVGFVDTTLQGGDVTIGKQEIDYSDPVGDEASALARDNVYCRTLMQEDLPALIRIDRHITGLDHSGYYQRKVREVVEETGIRVSMVAEIKGQICGFIMARVDFGEFDRTEPTAVLDTFGVDPAYGHQQVGSALLSQLLANLTSLRLEKIRTVVGADHFDILNFLMKNGFRTSQQVAFVKRIEGRGAGG